MGVKPKSNCWISNDRWNTCRGGICQSNWGCCDSGCRRSLRESRSSGRGIANYRSGRSCTCWTGSSTGWSTLVCTFAPIAGAIGATAPTMARGAVLALAILVTYWHWIQVLLIWRLQIHGSEKFGFRYIAL